MNPPFSTPQFHKDISLEEQEDNFILLSARKGEFPVLDVGIDETEFYNNNDDDDDTLSVGTLDGRREIAENHVANQGGKELVVAGERRRITERQKRQSSVLRYFSHSPDSMNSEKIMDDYFTRLLAVFKMDESGPMYTTLSHGNGSSNSNSDKTYASDNIPPSSTHKVSLETYMSSLSHPLLTATKTGAPAQIGHMSSCLPFFHKVLAKVIVGLNQNVVKVETSASFTTMEREVIRGMHHDFWQMPHAFYQNFGESGEYCLGIACSGGTLANLTALWVARNSCLSPRNQFTGVAKEGLAAGLVEYGYNGACVIGSRMMHYSFRKGVDLLGLGESGLKIVDTDDEFRVKIDSVREMIAACKRDNILIIAIIGICGTTETGSIDPLQALGTLAAASQIHFHVDAAWGGPLIYSPAHSSKLHGMELADSITIDGHKQLYTPMGLGLVLFKQAMSAKVIEKSAGYVIRANSMDLGKFGIEGSRPAHILYLHASLSLLGRGGIGMLVERGCALVRQLRNRLVDWHSGAWQVLHAPMSNILLFRYIPTMLRLRRQKKPSSRESGSSTGGGGSGSGSDDGDDGDDDEFKKDVDELNWYVEKMQAIASGIRDKRPHCFTSRTTVVYKGTSNCAAFRVVVANPRTGWRHIVQGMQELERIGGKCEREREVDGIMERLGREAGVDDYRKIAGWPLDI